MKLFTYFILIVISFLSHAQNIGLFYTRATPNGEFNKNIDRAPEGLSLNASFSIHEKINIGGEIGVSMYSNVTYEVPYQSRMIEVYEEDCFWTFHAFGEYLFIKKEKLELYGEARVGLTNFFSDVTALDDYTDDYQGEFKAHGSAFNTGIGIGIRYSIGKLFKIQNQKLWISTSYTVNSGSKSTYRNAGETRTSFSNGQHRSLTNYSNFKLGLQYGF